MKLTLTLILAICGLSSFSQSVSLALNLKQDSVYYLTTDVTSTVNQIINGGAQNSEIKINGKVAHKVIAVQDTIYQMSVWYKSLKMHMDMMRQIVDFDSANKDKDMLSKLMSTLIDKPFTMAVSKAGRVLEVKGVDKLFDGMFDGLQGVAPEQMAKLKAQLEKSYGEKNIKSNFQDAFPMLPVNKVSMADKWVAVSTIETAGTVKINTNYSLRESKDNYNLIHGDAILKSEGDSKYVMSNNLPIRLLNVSGTTTSDIKLDKNTGWIIDAKTIRMVKMTAEIQDTPKTPGGIKIPMSVSANTVLSGS